MNALPAKGAAYETLIANRTFIVLDIETTTWAATDGGNRTTYPIAVGAVVLRNGTRRETFHTLTDPGVPVDEASSKYNGITTTDLEGADGSAAALVKLDAFLENHPDAFVVCHNAHFDITHLHTAYVRAGMRPFTRPVIDTEFLPIRLHIAGAVARPKLTGLATHYGVATTLTSVPKASQRLYKALIDAQNTAEVLSWLMAEAAAQGITDFDDFLTKAKPKSSDDIASHTGRKHRRAMPPSIPDGHIKNVHGGRGLPPKTSDAQLDKWTNQVRQCVHLHCPFAAEKVIIEAHRPGLLDRLTPLLSDCNAPGDIGTFLGAIETLLVNLDRTGARAWYRTNHATIKAAPPCDEAHSCPHCVAGQACPKDTTYQLLTRRALDYGLTRTGEPVSLFSRRVKDDLWDTGNDRKMDTWPAQGMHEMAAYMMWMLIDEASRKRNTTRELDIIDKVVTRNLHEYDPRLALAVARHWATDPGKEPAIEQLVETMRSKATTDTGHRQLDMWFDGPHKEAIVARAAAKVRKAKRSPKGLRRVAPIERRPTEIQHNYRYQLHRKAEVS